MSAHLDYKLHLLPLDADLEAASGVGAGWNDYGSEAERKLLDLYKVLQAALPLGIVDVEAGAGHRLLRVVVCGGQDEAGRRLAGLTAADLELTGVPVQRVVIEVHPAGDRDPDPEQNTEMK